MLIFNTDENVFDGFTPVKRESDILTGTSKGDISLESFSFTLTTPTAFWRGKSC
jgi:hypothetical protein